MNYDLLLVQNYEIFRRFAAHFVSGTDLEKYWAAQDSYTITIKQTVRFQERMHLEKFQVDKIQNHRTSAIIHLNRPAIAEYHENRSR